jgi:hypothetical protein
VHKIFIISLSEKCKISLKKNVNKRLTWRVGEEIRILKTMLIDLISKFQYEIFFIHIQNEYAGSKNCLNQSLHQNNCSLVTRASMGEVGEPASQNKQTDQSKKENKHTQASILWMIEGYAKIIFP